MTCALTCVHCFQYIRYKNANFVFFKRLNNYSQGITVEKRFLATFSALIPTSLS